jgi:hypothetical protein
LEEHRKIGENIIKSETTDVSIQAGGGATVDKPIVEVDRLGEIMRDMTVETPCIYLLENKYRIV